MQETNLYIACLLFNGWGGSKPAQYVEKLFNMISRNTTRKFNFSCFTDNPVLLKDISPDIHIRKMPKFNYNQWKFNLPKFYIHKLGLFSANAQVFLFDLDMVITANIDDILDYDGDFCGIQPFNRSREGKSIGGGLLSFRSGQTNYFWEMISDNPEGWATWSQGGKERLILSKFANDRNWKDSWQNLFPGKLISYKRHIRRKRINHIPEGASIVALHGKPKQHELPSNDVLMKHWY